MQTSPTLNLPYTHPVDDTTKGIITAKLRELEEQHHIRILYACESGSRAWGFASPDSDYDVRFVYVHAPQWYLSVHRQRDVLELPISNELDISGWELRKTLQLLAVSNPTLLEWLQSPIVYCADAAQHQKLHTLAHDFFNPVKAWHHYQSMARKNYQAYLRQDTVRYKKYLYALRPLLAAQWVRANQSVPPMRFVDLAEKILHPQKDAVLIDSMRELLTRKMQAGEAETTAPWPVLQAWIQSIMAHNTQQPFTSAYTAPEYTALNHYLCETVLG